MCVVDTRAQIIHLLAYKKSAFHTVAEHIDYMYHWIVNLWYRDVHEFFIEQQIQIVDTIVDSKKISRKLTCCS